MIFQFLKGAEKLTILHAEFWAKYGQKGSKLSNVIVPWMNLCPRSLARVIRGLGLSIAIATGMMKP